MIEIQEIPKPVVQHPAAADREERPREAVLQLRDVGVAYAGKPAVADISLDVYAKQITALIGPSGCGKSTLIRVFNRMNDLIPAAEVQGQVMYHGEDLYAPGVDPVDVRKRIGMVFQKPNPFPKSIRDNLTFGMKVNGFKATDERVEQVLRS
ncbi:MAG TPA: ATP-binding cassette domain-containing protein, partial [Solirubrobacterales bacterium]|nr:ATP-binding cassette domain-containing protein [Solirubrobacterales bacterium]